MILPSLVSSWLDYRNSILYGTSSSNLNKLQRLQNALAGTVMMTNKRDHITPVLARLHWLPVTACIQFKIALLTFKTLTTHQPSYIHDLLQLHCLSQPLRSTACLKFCRRDWFRSTQLHLQCSTRLEQSTSRHHWQLGRHCKHFKKKLKTFYRDANISK